MARPTVQLNFMVSQKLNEMLEEYCVKKNISKTAAVAAALKNYLKESVNMWILTSPDNGNYTQDHAHEVISDLAERFNVSVQPTGRTRDRGAGQEEEYIVSGSPDDVQAFQEELKEALY